MNPNFTNYKKLDKYRYYEMLNYEDFFKKMIAINSQIKLILQQFRAHNHIYCNQKERQLLIKFYIIIDI